MLKSALVLIFDVLVHSKLVYCIEAWGNIPETHFKETYITQKPMIHTVFDKISHFRGLETAPAGLEGGACEPLPDLCSI